MQRLCYRVADESKESEQVPTSAHLLDTFRTNFGEMRHLKVFARCHCMADILGYR